MFQGAFHECVEYLKRNGIDYTTLCIEKNRNCDIQISFRMFSIVDNDGSRFELKARDGRHYELKFTDLKPVAPDTFRIDHDIVKLWRHYVHKTEPGKTLVKFGSARAF